MKPGRDGAPSPVNPGDSATRQEVRLGEPPTRTRWGGYPLARPGGPPGPKGVYYPQNQTSNLKSSSVASFGTSVASFKTPVASFGTVEASFVTSVASFPLLTIGASSFVGTTGWA